MSERMSNTDIEDVLSSIRRLVSDDLRPGHAAVPQPTPAPARPPVPRLVLTPALRVSPDPVPAPPPVQAEARDTLADRLAELEVLMAGQAPDFEDEVAPAVPVSPDAALFDRVAGAGPAPVDSPAVPEAPHVDADAEPDAPPALPRDTADATVWPEGSLDEGLLQNEAVLRALIRDVLREELQGVMGERVTRNLRKLIRAEIARALTARGIA